MSSRRGKDRDGLSDEDLRLWWRVARSVVPLPGRKLPEPPPAAEGGQVAKEPAAPPPPRELPPVPRPRAAAPHRLSAGLVEGIDHRTAQRLRRGQLPVDAHCDLHGLTRERAREVLAGFLAQAQARHCRCVVVVTGKGQRGPLEPHTGVLKAALPHWLNEPGNRQRVLAFAPARPRHGGEGAFYILLKKSR